MLQEGGRMNLEKLTEDWLKKNKLAGLYNRAGECACKIGDLMPCGEPQNNCTAGVEVPCDCEGHLTTWGSDCTFHIVDKEAHDEVDKD